ncbi:MAG: hypothetical protein H3C47_06765 [Candidatus Cloacimonetes bacterium]|nr:hypothetical protein [Candidatus Cloacimonadota bacterium]
MYKITCLFLYALFGTAFVFAEPPSHSDIAIVRESVQSEPPSSNITASDFQIIIPPVTEQYTIVSESALSSVTEVARILQNALLSAISTPSETQTSQQLYILQLVESTLGQLVVSEPLRELLFSHTQTLFNLFKDQPPKLENLALTMVHALFLENLFGVQTLPEQDLLRNTKVIQNQPLLLEITALRPLMNSQRSYHRLQLLEKVDSIETQIRGSSILRGEIVALVLASLRSLGQSRQQAEIQAGNFVTRLSSFPEYAPRANRSSTQYIHLPDQKLQLVKTATGAKIRLTGKVAWCGKFFGGGPCWPHDWLPVYIIARHSTVDSYQYHDLFRVPLASKIAPGTEIDIQSEDIFQRFKQQSSAKPGIYNITVMLAHFSISSSQYFSYYPSLTTEWQDVEYTEGGQEPPSGMTVSLDSLSVTQVEGAPPSAKSDVIYLSNKKPVKLESRLSLTEKFTQNDQYEFEFLMEMDGNKQSLLKRRVNAATFSGSSAANIAMTLLPLEMVGFEGKEGKIIASLRAMDRSKSTTINKLVRYGQWLVKVLSCDEPKAEVAPTNGILSDYYNVQNCNFEVEGDSDPDEYYIRITEHTLSLRSDGEDVAAVFHRGSLALNNVSPKEEPLIDGITSPGTWTSSLKTKGKKFSFRFVSRPVYFPIDLSDGEHFYKTPVEPLVKFHIKPVSSILQLYTTAPVLLSDSGNAEATSMQFPIKQPRETIVSHQGVSNPFWFAKSIEQFLEHYKHIPYVNQVLRQLDIHYGMEKKVQREIVNNPYVVKLWYAHILDDTASVEHPAGIFKPGDLSDLSVPGKVVVESFYSITRRNAEGSGVYHGIPQDMTFKYNLLGTLLHELRHAYQHVLAHTDHTKNLDKDYFVPCDALATGFSIYGYGECNKFQNGLTIQGIRSFKEIDHGFLIDPVKLQISNQTISLGCNILPGHDFIEGVNNSLPDSALGSMAREADSHYFEWWFTNNLNDKTPLPIKPTTSLPAPQFSNLPSAPTSSLVIFPSNPPLLCHLPVNTFYKAEQDWIESKDHTVIIPFHKVANQCVLVNGSIANKTEKTVQVQFRSAAGEGAVSSPIKEIKLSFLGLEKIPENVQSCDGGVSNFPKPVLIGDPSGSTDSMIRVKVQNFPNSTSQPGVKIWIQVNSVNVSSSFNYNGKYLDIPFNPQYSYCTKPGSAMITQTKKSIVARFMHADFPNTVGLPGSLEISRVGVEIAPAGYTCFQNPVPQLKAPTTNLNTNVVQTKTFDFELLNLPSAQGAITKVSSTSQAVGGVAQSDTKEVRGSRVTINYRKLFSHCAYLQNPPLYGHQKQISLQYKVPGLSPGPTTKWTQNFEGWDYHPGPSYSCHRE